MKTGLLMSLFPKSEANVELNLDVLSALNNPDWISLAVNQQSRCCVVFGTVKTDYSVEVSLDKNGVVVLSGGLFVKSLYDLMQWSLAIPHSIQGKRVVIGGAPAVLFNFDAAEELPKEESNRRGIG